uniref:Disintegrin and metalloproteinase domain-containing protein B n=1 Tax=Moniliophthora roreri TaxID=221103 RepID=A0A0W0FZ96_MONRR
MFTFIYRQTMISFAFLIKIGYNPITASITFSSVNPNSYEGAFNLRGKTYHILNRENYLRFHPEEQVDDEVVIFPDDGKAVECGHDRMEWNTNHPINFPTSRSDWNPFETLWRRDDIIGDGMNSNFADTIGSTAGCPTEQRILHISMAADCEYVSHYGSVEAATDRILTDMNSVSGLFRDSFNVSLGIVELAVMNPTCPSQVDQSTPWNQGCSTSVPIDTKLSLFSEWRGRRSQDGAGLWHLMSGCPTGQEVGIAWLGTLCQATANTNSNGGQTVSGTGVSTFGQTEWQVVAHEIGHNFGAIHDVSLSPPRRFEGLIRLLNTCDTQSRFIMSPVTRDGEYAFSDCSKGNICSLMQPTTERATNTSCLFTTNSPEAQRPLISLRMCGNGIVERDQGEECDPGTGKSSPCCDSSTCKLINNAKCDPMSGGGCCTDQCDFAPSSQVCRPAVDSNCDVAEQCTGSSADCPSDQHQPNGQTCGRDNTFGDELKCASGRCTSIGLQCRQIGASLNLTRACPQADKSCQVTCQDPSNSNSCVRLSSMLADGSECGFGGFCEKGSCNEGNWWNVFTNWYRRNLQIAIPVTVVAGLLILSILYCCLRSLFRRAHRPAPSKYVPVGVINAPPGHQRIPSYVPGTPGYGPRNGFGAPPPPSFRGTDQAQPFSGGEAYPMAQTNMPQSPRHSRVASMVSGNRLSRSAWSPPPEGRDSGRSDNGLITYAR